jgi:hypothetical protein
MSSKSVGQGCFRAERQLNGCAKRAERNPEDERGAKLTTVPKGM